MYDHQHSPSAQVHFDNVSVHYYSLPKWLGGKPFAALSGLDLHIETQNLAIVGPSGAGKSTLIELLFGLRKPSIGEVHVCGYPMSLSTTKQRLELCKHIQLIPQEPHTSLNPYYTVRQILAEPMTCLGDLDDQDKRISQALAEVGLASSLLGLKPHQLSVGQAQRVAIARALVVEPCVLVADEPTASLDPISRQQVLGLLKQLQRHHGMRLILVTHDLHAASELCDELLVLDHGKVVEQGLARHIFTQPSHPTTQALIQAQQLAKPMNQ